MKKSKIFQDYWQKAVHHYFNRREYILRVEIKPEMKTDILVLM